MIHKSIHLLIIALIVTSYCSCKKSSGDVDSTTQEELPQTQADNTRYAQGFRIITHDNYTHLQITRAFPGTDKVYNYALVPKSKKHNKIIASLKDMDAIISVPLESIVVTSTTHIPSLEMLGVENTLVGFPGLDYISSPLSRKRIHQNLIKELGKNEALNTELTIDLRPDIIVAFGVEGENKTLNSLQRAQIPVIYNGDWVERHPLGKAEWIKFFGALYGKERKADSIFKMIEANYLESKDIASRAAQKPTILSGAMYKDVWYVPKGDSWQAKIIEDAGGKYLWSHTKGVGSVALSIESVLDKAQQATYWIAPAQYVSYSKLLSDNKVYGEFEAFKNENVYTFAKRKGETGGIVYYELAPNRPDLVMKDLVSILHPELMPPSSEFFTPLDE